MRHDEEPHGNHEKILGLAEKPYFAVCLRGGQIRLMKMPDPAPIDPPPAPRPMPARTRLILEGRPLPTLLRLAAPNVLNLLAIAGMITFDGLFLGRLGADALAGVSLAFPFVMLIQHTAASGMGGGVTSAIARALGAGKRDVADALVLHAFLLALALGALFSAVLLLGAPFFFVWMGGEGAALTHALDYAVVAFGGAVAICLLNILGSAVRGTGNMGLPAAVIVGSVAAHLVLSPILIFGLGPIPAQGPAGAGWGLILSFAGGSLVLIAHLRSPRCLVTLRFGGVALRGTLFADILKVGVPGLANVAITNLSVVLLTGVAGRLGQDVAIGYAMGARLEYILIPLAFGFGTAIVAMVGTNWGAGQHERARRIAWTGGATVAATCGAIGLFFALFPGLWMSLFTDDPAILEIGSWYLRILGPFYTLYGLGMALYFATQGLGSAVWTVAANGARLVTSVLLAVIATHGMALDAIGLFGAIGIGFALYGLLTVLAMRRAAKPRPVIAPLVKAASVAALAFLLATAPARAQDEGRAQTFGDAFGTIGLLQAPVGTARPMPVVLMVHDTFGIETRGHAYVAQLLAAGIAVLETELRANPPDGYPEPLPGAADAALLVRRAVEALSRDARFNPDRIGALGFGLGARTILLARPSLGDAAAISARVLLYPGCRSLPADAAIVSLVQGRRRIATLLLHGDADPANPPGACQRLASLLAAEGPTRRIGYPGATYAWDQPQVGGSLSTAQPAPDVPDRIASAFWAELAELSAANAASFFLSTLRIGPGIGDGDRGPHHTREHRR